MAIGTDSGSLAQFESKRTRLNRLWGALDTEAQTFTPHWQDLCQYILPRRGRFYLTDNNRGDRRNTKIIDSTATMAVRTLKSGMHAGMTSPARPWMRLTVPDPDLAEFRPVKEWLHIVTTRMLEVFLKSNVYNILPTIYGDEATFGTAACAFMRDPKTVVRGYPFPVGSYRLALDDTGRVDTFMREYRMTVRQIVQRFGKTRERSGSPDWSPISSVVKTLWDRGNFEEWVDVMHTVYPNPMYDPNRETFKFKQWSSCYYERGGSEEKYLREGGHNMFPILAPRWDVAAEDIYGTDCPGMTALGDIRAIQLMHKRKSQAVEKMVNPPMTAPTSLRNSRPSILPGDTTYVDVREGQQGFKPAHTVDPKVMELKEDIRDYQARISRAFFEDLFLMLSMSDRREITAREVDERHEEKLLMLGPTLERNDSELYKPMIDLTFPAMVDAGMIPEAPQEIEGMELKVEYISIMAQAQKMVGLASIERFGNFVAAIGEVNPEVFDKVNTDEMVDEYHDRMGLPPRLIRTDDEAESIRQRRAEAAQQQAAAENARAMADAANKASKADTSGKNLLTDLGQAQEETLPL
jgi:hypothetical protein